MSSDLARSHPMVEPIIPAPITATFTTLFEKGLNLRRLRREQLRPTLEDVEPNIAAKLPSQSAALLPNRDSPGLDSRIYLRSN